MKRANCQFYYAFQGKSFFFLYEFVAINVPLAINNARQQSVYLPMAVSMLYDYRRYGTISLTMMPINETLVR